MDNRIPPPLVATLFGVLMWFAARHLPGALELSLAWRTGLALAQDLSDKPRIGQWRPRLAHQPLRCRIAPAVAVKAEGRTICHRTMCCAGRGGKRFQPLRDLADLMSQVEQRQAIMVGQFAHRRTAFGQHAA